MNCVEKQHSPSSVTPEFVEIVWYALGNSLQLGEFSGANVEATGVEFNGFVIRAYASRTSPFDLKSRQQI